MQGNGKFECEGSLAYLRAQMKTLTLLEHYDPTQ